MRRSARARGMRKELWSSGGGAYSAHLLNLEEIMNKRRLKRELLEMFFRKDFLELKDKKAAIKECFYYDLKWVIGYSIFIMVSAAIVLLFGR